MAVDEADPTETTAGTGIESATSGESLLSSDLGKEHIKYTAGVYAAVGAAIGLLVIIVAAVGSPVTPGEEASGLVEFDDVTSSLLAMWAIMGAPFLAGVLAVGTARDLSRTVEAATEEVAKVAAAATAAGTAVLMTIAIFLAETELAAGTLSDVDTSIDFGNLLIGAVAAGVVVGVLAATTVYADRELRPNH